MKVLVTLLAATVALTGCANVTAPTDTDADAQAAAAKRRLEAASKDAGPMVKLAAN
ncbi:MAG: hypothetical protein H7099_16465 [Gemmatimonadaceae bacterium]|nr:hypothetical protein [Gemmatimonadaceae bacterium]